MFTMRPGERRNRVLSAAARPRTSALRRLVLERDVAAEMNFQAKFGEHRGFNAAGAMSLPFIRRVNDLDVI